MLDRAGLVQLVLVEVDVEVDPEVVQVGLDLVEHQLDAGRPEHLLSLVVRQRQGVRVVGQHPLGDVADVGAAVAVLRRRLALGRGQQRPGVPVDLGAVVVEVVLLADGRALRGQDPGQGVADRGPARAAQVQRPGRVGRDELEVEPLAGQQVGVPVRRAGGHDRPGQLSGGRGVQHDVEEARTGDRRRS